MATVKEAEHETTHVDVAHQDATFVEVIALADNVQTTKQSPWTIHNARCFGVLCVAYLCAFMNGYDGSLMGSVSPCSLIVCSN